MITVYYAYKNKDGKWRDNGASIFENRYIALRFLYVLKNSKDKIFLSIACKDSWDWQWLDLRIPKMN